MTKIIGNIFVRTLASGKYVVSETVKGKTFTTVLNQAGDVLKITAKELLQESVGDKFVKTATKVVHDAKKPGFLIKTIERRVYDKNGKLLETVKDTYYAAPGKDFVKDTSIK